MNTVTTSDGSRLSKVAPEVFFIFKNPISTTFTVYDFPYTGNRSLKFFECNFKKTNMDLEETRGEIDKPLDVSEKIIGIMHNRSECELVEFSVKIILENHKMYDVKQEFAAILTGEPKLIAFKNLFFVFAVSEILKEFHVLVLVNTSKLTDHRLAESG